MCVFFFVFFGGGGGGGGGGVYTGSAGQGINKNSKTIRT